MVVQHQPQETERSLVSSFNTRPDYVSLCTQATRVGVVAIGGNIDPTGIRLQGINSIDQLGRTKSGLSRVVTTDISDYEELYYYPDQNGQHDEFVIHPLARWYPVTPANEEPCNRGVELVPEAQQHLDPGAILYHPRCLQ